MDICTRSLATVPTHAHNSPKAPFIVLEHFRRNRQDFRRGFAFVYRPNRVSRILPLV